MKSILLAGLILSVFIITGATTIRAQERTVDSQEGIRMDMEIKAMGYISPLLGGQPEYDKAAKIYTALIRNFPGEAKYYAKDPYFGRALCYKEMGKFSAAVADYNKAIQLQPDHAYHYAGRAAAWGKRTDWRNSAWTPSIDKVAVKKAIEDLNQAIRLEPNTPEFHNGSVYAYNGELSEARAEYNKALKLYEASGTGQGSYIPMTKNQIDQVDVMATDNYYDLSVETLKRWANIAGGIFNSKGLSKTIKLCSELIKRFPDESEWYMYRGIAYFHSGDFARSVADHKQAIKLKPNDPTKHYILADTYEKMGDFENAKREAEETIKLAPDDEYSRELSREIIQRAEKKLKSGRSGTKS